MKIKLATVLGSAALVAAMATTSLAAQASEAKKAQGKPFLIQGQLPHLTMMVKIFWDDEDVLLTKKQKEQLMKIRIETMSGAKALAKQINPLEASIVKRSNEGASTASLKADVEKLAALRAEATIIHLDCIYKTRKALTKEQLEIIE
jgi:Spy/CpxP family protein refolding chaperone